MITLLTSFFTSFIVTLLIIKSNHLHSHLTADSDMTSPQKNHHKITPRVGGISIAFGLFFALILRLRNNQDFLTEIIFFLCALPTFAIGLAEDVTKLISVRNRLLLTATSSALMIYLLKMHITRLDVPILDFMFAIPIFATIFTIFAMTGLANAYNIIDGFHGLSSMVGIITLIAITYLGYLLSDLLVVSLSLAMIGAILGFFIWNYPCGLIFLGDGGAYLIGFWIAALTILLTYQHQEISPWFALLINGYPIIETLFTIYRRKIHQGQNPGEPDGIHFHTLIYRRILKNHSQGKDLFASNAKTAPFLWIMAILSVVPSVLWWQSTPILIGASTLFVISYLWLYSRIVKFKTPKWLHSGI